MIITDETLLRTPCSDVLPSEVDDLRFLLEKELRLSGEQGQSGIGLAAPQIGIYKKMAIVRIPFQNKTISVDLVNCHISSYYDKFLFEEEGCLSFPGQIVKSFRYREIVVTNNLVRPHNFIATGILAVCIQHELNHLEGILLPDVAIKPAKPAKPLPINHMIEQALDLKIKGFQ